jgi:hypothetical protein
MNIAQVGVLLAALTLAGQAAVYFVSGGFSVSGELAAIRSDVRIIKSEMVSIYKLHDYKISVLENRLPIANSK